VTKEIGFVNTCVKELKLHHTRLRPEEQQLETTEIDPTGSFLTKV